VQFPTVGFDVPAPASTTFALRLGRAFFATVRSMLKSTRTSRLAVFVVGGQSHPGTPHTPQRLVFQRDICTIFLRGLQCWATTTFLHTHTARESSRPRPLANASDGVVLLLPALALPELRFGIEPILNTAQDSTNRQFHPSRLLQSLQS